MPDYIGGKDIASRVSSIIPFPMDGIDYARVIQAEHTRIHQQQGYVCSGIQSLANGGKLNYYFTNPLSNFVHLRHWEVVATDNPVAIALYETPTLADSTSASDLACNNAARYSSYVSSLEITVGTSVSNVGTQLEHALIVGGKDTGGPRGALAVEWVLSQNKDYLLQVENQSGNAVQLSHYFFWYQPLQVA